MQLTNRNHSLEVKKVSLGLNARIPEKYVIIKKGGMRVKPNKNQIR